MSKANNYKALIIDVDGTLVPNSRDGKPSLKVQQAIQKASKQLHIGIASGRPLFLLNEIFDTLSLTGPSIIRGGAQIYDATTKTILWEKAIKKDALTEAARTIWGLGHELRMDGEKEEVTLTKSNFPKNVDVFELFVPMLNESQADLATSKLSQISTLAIHKVPDWTRGFALNITHASATKQHGILEVAQTLGIETHEIIAIGDGGNDLPLLMACGLRVAMGNAFAELKAIADYIAPSVTEDGVADVIDKFILKRT